MTTANQRFFGLAGLSGSGKTTLICDLIARFQRRGLSISTIKHAHHRFDVDIPGKDSYRHRESGATEVMVASAARFALMHENRDSAEPELADLLRHMAPVDLILVEGFKREDFPKMLVHRGDFQAHLGIDDLEPFQSLVAIASSDSDKIDPAISLPILPLDDPEALVDFILNWPGRT